MQLPEKFINIFFCAVQIYKKRKKALGTSFYYRNNIFTRKNTPHLTLIWSRKIYSF